MENIILKFCRLGKPTEIKKRKFFFNTQRRLGITDIVTYCKSLII